MTTRVRLAFIGGGVVLSPRLAAFLSRLQFASADLVARHVPSGAARPREVTP